MTLAQATSAETAGNQPHPVTSVGFIGLGNVGSKLAGSLLRNGYHLTVRDLDRGLAEPFLAQRREVGRLPKADGAGL